MIRTIEQGGPHIITPGPKEIVEAERFSKEIATLLYDMYSSDRFIWGPLVTIEGADFSEGIVVATRALYRRSGLLAKMDIFIDDKCSQAPFVAAERVLAHMPTEVNLLRQVIPRLPVHAYNQPGLAEVGMDLIASTDNAQKPVGFRIGHDMRFELPLGHISPLTVARQYATWRLQHERSSNELLASRK